MLVRNPNGEEGERGIVIVPSNADSRPGRLFLPLDGGHVERAPQLLQ